jgi:hypothetical protein
VILVWKELLGVNVRVGKVMSGIERRWPWTSQEEAFSEDNTNGTLDFSSLTKYEKINFCCLSHLGLTIKVFHPHI